MTAKTSVRAADGAMVYLEFDDHKEDLLGYPWFGHVRFLPKYGRRGTTAEMWGLDLAPTSSLGAGIESVRGRETARFALAGGEVVVAQCAEPANARWAAWMGPWHIAHGMFYAPTWESEDIVELFTRVHWVDTPEGMTADPRGRFDFAMAVCLRSVTGVGLLNVQSKRLAGTAVPRWRGATVPSGEIWQVPDQTGAAQTSLLHVSGSAVTNVLPHDVPAKNSVTPSGIRGAGTPQHALEFLSSVRRLDWVA